MVELVINNGEKEEGRTDYDDSSEEIVDPLGLVLKIVMMNWAAQNHAMLIHACAAFDGTDTYVFSGHSTDGKSTIARLWKDDGKVIGGEILLLKKDNSDYYVYGIPLHFHETTTALQRMKINKIFVISHSPGNQISRLGVSGATSALLARCFAPRWDRKGMEATVGLASHVTKDLPCYSLGFVPDKSVVSFLKTHPDVNT
jgi:hypothetical protein